MLSFATIYFLSLTILQQGDRPKTADESELDFWMRTAASAASQIDEPKYAGQCLLEIAAIYADSGDVVTAAALCDQIEPPEPRLTATIALAQAKQEIGDAAGCLLELESAQQLAKNHGTQCELLRAYVRIAKRSDLAKNWILGMENPHLNLISELCEEMAASGEMQFAIKTADEADLGEEDRKTLRTRIGFAVAKAGRVEDTEFAVANLIEESDDYYRDSLWLKLAEALHEAGKYEPAQQYVLRVKQNYIVRTNSRLMARIETGQPKKKTKSPEQPLVEMILENFGKSELTKGQALTAAGVKELEIEQKLRLAKANPKAPTTGQFGPWNQEGELAKIRSELFRVSTLYRLAGKGKKADKKLAEALKAFQDVVTENPFIAKLTLYDFLYFQVQHGDLKGLQAIAEKLEPAIWSKAADWIVLLLLWKGEVEVAEKLAIRVLTNPTMFGPGSKYDAKELISGFVEAKHLTRAHKILRAGKPEIAGPACWEEAGRLMVEKDLGLLLQTRKWSRSLPPMHRFYIALGAAKQSRITAETK